jgi:hypothetical protein
MKYRKKPVVIEAVCWTGLNRDEIVRFMGVVGFTAGNPTISTLEGELTVSIGDWIIKGVKGEFYPCKPDIFAMTYDPIDGVNEQYEQAIHEAQSKLQ